jgi:hypothetical protein
MKIPNKFTIANCRLPIAEKSGGITMPLKSGGRTASAGARVPIRHSQSGIALVITLIMLSVTLVMALAFLALAKRERGSVSTGTDKTVALNAARSGLDHAQAQVVANMLSSFNTNVNAASSNAYNLHLLVSTNYINPLGFVQGGGSYGSPNPTNVNYAGPFATVDQRNQNIANLYFLPRAPVFVPTNPAIPGYDFRYYLDLNENGSFDPNGIQLVISPDAANPYYYNNPNNPNDPRNGQTMPTILPGLTLSNFCVGDPEWIGVLEHPDAPHGPNNHFTSRYTFLAVPSGNALDINYLHNQAWNTPLGNGDGYMRNQGVGSWEINLAAFLADLNTNTWGRFVGSGPSAPANSASYYWYQRYESPSSSPQYANSGYAFQDAFSLLKYRYNSNALPNANNVLGNGYASRLLPVNGIDNYSMGPLQTNLDYPWPNQRAGYTLTPWSGADNTNHLFTLSDFLDGSKSGTGPNTFTNRLRSAGTAADTYDRYTFYRMLDQLGSDSSPDDGRLNLNYSNAVVNYSVNRGVSLPSSINIVTGAETNLVHWTPLNFFHAAADQMLRFYSSNWLSANFAAYTNTFRMTTPMSITNIPVWVSNQFVYTPAVHRLLQLAANFYDATTNFNYNLPHVFQPVLEKVNNNGDIFIVGYVPVSPYDPADPATLAQHLAAPVPLSNLSRAVAPTVFLNGRAPVNVYGVPWIIGAKKGLPNFNQFALLTTAEFTRKLEYTRTSVDPKTAIYKTNQMYIIGISNNMGVAFWNSYSNVYPRPLNVYASGYINMVLTNGLYLWTVNTNYAASANVPAWWGSRWSGSQPNANLTNLMPVSQQGCVLPFNWSYVFQSPMTYNFATGKFDPTGQWQATSPSLPLLPQFGMLITNHLQAYILDGNNVIDYVQLQDPTTAGGLNQALADPNYAQGNNNYYQWSTNASSGPPNIPYGDLNQWTVSETGPSIAPPGGAWLTLPNITGQTTPQAEAKNFFGFFAPSFQFNGVTYHNGQLVQQAPYTPTRTVFVSYLLQANDPLVHTLASDLNSQYGTTASWGQGVTFYNGIWSKGDVNQQLPPWPPPASPVYGRYQPWGAKGQMSGMSGVDGNLCNLAYKDPIMWTADNWDFPTNAYPTVGWLGRVHRGTPWQTIFLKSTNILAAGNGAATWANWTADISTNYFSYYFDATNSGPAQDYLLFDLFTTRYNDNAVRGTLPVNVGMGRADGGLAAWSALFSGMVTLSNNASIASIFTPLTYTSTNIVNPAGVLSSSLAYTQQPALWQIVNGPLGINATRANTNLNRYQAFTHAGSVLETPALSSYSPFLNQGGLKLLSQQWEYGINDEEYEWLPQQLMGLVRGTEQRYVVYCYGQSLRPAPNGTVLSGPFFQLVTNYQVVAESAVRAVIRVDGANTSQPHAVVESYNVLPPY